MARKAPVRGSASPRPRPVPLLRVVHETRATVAASLEHCKLRGGRVVVAVSGGQDSLTLLDSLHALRDDLGLELVCAHFDHRLRGADSEADAEFVRQLCESVGLECVLGAAEACKPLRGEEAARDARYGFLSQVATSTGADAIALGHTATDRAETVLLNIVRGAGLSGLAAMGEDSARTIGGVDVRLLRPLLSLARRTTEDYCEALGLAPRIDASNASEEFARNRVRKALMPALRNFNPRVEESLVRLAGNASQALELVEEAVDGAWPAHVTEIDEATTLDRTAFSLQPAVRTALVRRAIRRLRGDLKDVRQTHIDEVVGLLDGASGRLVSLPNGIEACSQADTVVLRRSGDDPVAALIGEYGLGVPGQATVPGWEISARVVERTNGDGREIDGDGSIARLDPALAEGALWVRGWLPGDRIQPLGLSGTKKVQDLFVDAKVPREDRATIPLLVCDRGIAWVAGHRMAEWAKVPSGSERWLQVKAKRSPRSAT